MPVGYNPNDQVGGIVGDGGSGRLMDPTTGAGLFNPNLDPAVVGMDDDGVEYAPGTDMSFGAPIRRQMQTNVINGDFSVLPPLGAGTNIVSDPGDAGYNPLPGWTWTPETTGLVALSMVADATYASGYKLAFTLSGAVPSPASFISQMVAVPMSQGQQYRALLSAFISGSAQVNFTLYSQFYKADGVTTVGGEASTLYGASVAEGKRDLGLVPTTAAYVKVRVSGGGVAGVGYLGEVRCAVLPAEASLGLKSLTASMSTTAETQFVGITVPADTFTAGSTYRITAYGVATNTSGLLVATTFRVRCGPFTLTGNIAGSRAPNMAVGAAADGWKVEFLFTVRTVGASGTALANGTSEGGPTQPWNTNSFVSATTATVAVDTTVANILELTAVTANANALVTTYQALIECVMAS